MKTQIKNQIEKEHKQIQKEKESLAQIKINAEKRIIHSRENIARLEKQLHNLSGQKNKGL